MARTKQQKDRQKARENVELPNKTLEHLDPEAEGEAILKQVRPRMGRIVFVECPLPEYEGLRVGFCTSNKYEVAQLLSEIPQKQPPIVHYRVWRLFMQVFDGWTPQNGFVDYDGNAIPAPDPSRPESYEVLHRKYFDLLQWCRFKGYEAAKEIALGPNSASG